MNEDYLWDKTGSDPAIEKLESALRLLSYEESPLPLTPTPIAETNTRRWFSLRFAPIVFASAVCLIILAVSIGLWIRPSAPSAPQSEVAMAGLPTPEAAAMPGSATISTVVPRAEAPVTASNTPRVITAARRPRRTEIRKLAVPQSAVVEAPQQKFTKEEIYAYNQLILALTITSEQLNQVREKTVGE